MTQWYYADALRQPQGPLSAEELQARLARGELSGDSLVWHEGMPQWQSLAECAQALGLPMPAPAMATPPALPAVATALPDGAGEDIAYAGLWRRVAANVIDSFITSLAVYAVVLPVCLVMGLGVGALGHAGSGADGVAVAAMAVAYLFGLLVPALYFGWLQSSRLQASLGKLAVGIKVVRGDGRPLGFWRSFLRYVAYVLVTLLTCGLGAVVTAFMAGLTRRKQAPHDFFCDTLVVDRWAFTDQPQRQRRGLDTVTIVVLVGYALLMLLAIVVVAAIVALAPSAHGWH